MDATCHTLKDNLLTIADLSTPPITGSSSILTSLGYQLVLNTKLATLNASVLKAIGSGGLQLQDDDGDLGLTIEDGGNVVIPVSVFIGDTELTEADLISLLALL
jgi:hypothetical protein